MRSRSALRIRLPRSAKSKRFQINHFTISVNGRICSILGVQSWRQPVAGLDGARYPSLMPELSNQGGQRHRRCQILQERGTAAKLRLASLGEASRNPRAGMNTPGYRA
jgi:hypothetical protein